MKLSFGQYQQQKQVQTLAPRMIQSMEILQMARAELEERIEQEMTENPVLEVKSEDPTLPSPEKTKDKDSSADVDQKELVVDSDNNADDFERLLNLDNDIPDHFDERPRMSSNRIQEFSDRQHDLMANVEDRSDTLQNHLIMQLSELDLENQLHTMCERIISALNAEDGGYLKTNLADLLPADSNEDDLRMAESALRIVQQLDPVGVAARDLRECLLLQLREDTPHLDELRCLINGHLEDLRDNRIPQIQKATGYTIEQINDAWAELRKLDPKPASQYFATYVPSVTPDLWIETDDEGNYIVKMDEGPARSLYISNYYRKRLESGKATPEEREFIKRKVNAAQWLMEAIEQRRSTLTRVAQETINHQRAFLDRGPEAIQPLKMQEIADIVGVHVTTVSRAVDDKWIETPRGIFPLRRFFVGGTQTDDGEDIAWDSIRIKLQELVDNEDKSKPLSDDELVKRLKAMGFNVARRTVNKYRQKLRIPSSRQRRDWSKSKKKQAE